MPWALLRNAEILKLLRKQFQKFSVRSKNPSLIKLRTEICLSVEHSLTCTCPHMGWVPALACCPCDQERTNPGTHLAPRRWEGAQSLPSHRAFAQSWEEKKIWSLDERLFYLTLMFQKHCERPLGYENTSSLFVPCNGTQRWQTFMESKVRKLMLSWEKSFLSLCGNSSSTLMGILDLSPSPTQWIISPLTQLLICSCSHQKQKENILPPLAANAVYLLMAWVKGRTFQSKLVPLLLLAGELSRPLHQASAGFQDPSVCLDCSVQCCGFQHKYIEYVTHLPFSPYLTEGY